MCAKSLDHLRPSVRIASQAIDVAVLSYNSYLVTTIFAVPIEKRVAGIPGLDVSSYQGNVNWGTVAADGAKWAYVKATEGTGYTHPHFSQQRVSPPALLLVTDKALSESDIKGGVRNHCLTLPAAGCLKVSSGTSQANYFVASGGGWFNNRKTLPGMLDIECTIFAFQRTSPARILPRPIGTPVDQWYFMLMYGFRWSTCTSESTSFSEKNPLFIARYAPSAGSVPPDWSRVTFPGAQDVFNGSEANLKKLATG
ncbi:glycoside hydrolase family 25 protein [Calocera cornea HHB12733]|uniref:Glycoside hydrolase family 25 protein n=1 Tax=Calocera cornea HHB12733 TaxID=1353952 RepID=A0A165FZ69_9BASI|nr:glycoside hydrolase family 25 protein [Calocera cornea HHB12733]